MEGFYLYCFARPAAARELNTPGVDERGPVRALEVHEVAAVYSAVSLEEFQCLQRDNPDAAWLTRRACRHEQIIEEVMRWSPVLPVRFGAVFSNQEVLEDLLKRRGPAISNYLRGVADKEEWAVKGLLDSARAADCLLSSDPVFAERYRCLPEAPGTRYFQEKRLRADLQQHTKLWAQGLAHRFADECQHVVEGAQRLKLAAANSPWEMIFHFAFLVKRDRLGEFRRRVAQAAVEEAEFGLTLQTTGPWPPFHFCPSVAELPS